MKPLCWAWFVIRWTYIVDFIRPSRVLLPVEKSLLLCLLKIFSLLLFGQSLPLWTQDSKVQIPLIRSYRSENENRLLFSNVKILRTNATLGQRVM